VKPEPPTKNLDAYLAIKNAKNNNQLDSLVGEPLSIYKNIQLYLNQSGAGWTKMKSWVTGYWPDNTTKGYNAVYEQMNDYVSNKRIIRDLFVGTPTKSMGVGGSQMTLINKKQNECFTKMIMAKNDSDFDNLWNEWISYWNIMNGDKITDEVNAWIVSHK
ncbi:MAG: hypothetical protein RRY18_04150, partial [Clostridia bacterium]